METTPNLDRILERTDATPLDDDPDDFAPCFTSHPETTDEFLKRQPKRSGINLF